MTEPTKKSKFALNTIVSILTVLIIGYIIICQKYATNSAIVGGPKYLLVQDNVVKLTIKKSFELLEIEFKNEVNFSHIHAIYEISKEGRSLIPREKYRIKIIENKIVKIAIPKKILGEISFRINLSGVESGSFPLKTYIKEIRLDKKKIGLKTFYKEYLDVKKSNLIFYKSFDIENISNFLATNIGNGILSLVIYSLLIIFFLQSAIFLITFIYRIITLKQIEVAEEAVLTVKYLDIFSRDYAIIIGFLGTVLSIWLALEVESTDYSNFFQILGIIKKAVFTSVLGLLIKCLYSIRYFFIKEFNLSK